jgi:membrane protein implicated in regulation of membrane protease activity
MKSTLAALGLAGLICIPCLLALGGGALVASGAVTLALAGNPVVQGVALLALVLGVAAGWRYVARRRACETDCAVPESEPSGSRQPQSLDSHRANGVLQRERNAEAAAAASERNRR